MTYTKHDTLPAYELARWDDPKDAMPSNRGTTTLPLWGNKDTPPPAIGARIQVTMNNLGPGTVRGYFVEGGWLGLLVEFHNPPAWWVKQNAPNRPLGHIFGIEFKLPEAVS